MKTEYGFEVRTARDALGLLSRKVYEKFGSGTLPLIENVCYKLGRSAGERMRKELPVNDFNSVANAFAEGAKRRNNPVDVIEITNKLFHLKGYRCNLGLKGAGRELCQAMMAMDRGVFEAASGEEIDLEIIKSLAANDDCCELVFRRRRERP